jgi:predicted amidophosphoribosyltransferase
MPVTIPGAPCAQCLGNGLSPFEKVVCLGVLKDPLKSVIHRMKYEHRWPLAERLADRIVQRSDLQAVLENAEVLVAVPLHRRRQRERGYNQAEVIARRLCRIFNSAGRKARDLPELDDDLPIDPQPSGSGYQRLRIARVAARVRPTETQTHLHSRAQRTENLRGAFVLMEPSKIEGKHVVLVDDVMTTGATLVTLARTLKPAKPASLSAIVLAVADPKGRAFEVI